MINSRLITDLDPPARIVCESQILQCKNVGIELLVTSTYRDFEAQADLFAIGRTKEIQRKPVTKARAGKSWHNYRCAWDVVPLIGGKAAWDDEKLWVEIIRIGKECGAEAGAEWKTFPDKPHFQVLPPAMNLARAFALFSEKGTIFTTLG